MFDNLKSHPLWEHSTDGWYAKYHSRCILADFGVFNEIPKIPKEFDSHYKVVRKIVWSADLLPNTLTYTIYTSDIALLEHIMSAPELNKHIEKIQTPVDMSHASTIIEFDTSAVHRSKLYYDHFLFKMTPTKYKNLEVELSKEAIKFIEDEIQDKRMVYAMGRTSRTWIFGSQRKSGFGSYPSSSLNIPTVYTNDEPGLMMFKLRFGSDIKFSVERVVLIKTPKA